jgi:hypothetical protein
MIHREYRLLDIAMITTTIAIAVVVGALLLGVLLLR